MQILNLALNAIQPYLNNPRRNDKAVKRVALSIEKYGFQQPIVVDKNYVIIVGHTRYKAAQHLNLLEVPVLVADNLDEDQVKAYRIADNKTNEYAEWDENLLAGELGQLLDKLESISQVSVLSAFSELEIDRILNGKTYLNDGIEMVKQRQGTINKRVGIIVLKNSYVNRGIATYVNGWLEWGLRNNVQVDVISDGIESNIENNQFDRYRSTSNWISPGQQSNAASDNKITMRSPIIRLKDSVDLRTALLEALTRYSYDALILSTIDTFFTAISLGLHVEHPNLYYVTHSVEDVGFENRDFTAPLTRVLLEGLDIKIITQADFIANVLTSTTTISEDRIFPLTPFLGQPELLKFNDNENRRGILYIGPYEARKNPEIFIMACKQSNKPAIVITPSQKSADKFKKRFLEEGIEHEIHVALTGQTKVEAIKQAALAIIPSVNETFCYTAFEAAHMCPTIVPSNRPWSVIHKDWCILIDEQDIALKVDEHYNKPVSEETRQALLQVHKQSDLRARELIELPFNEESHNNALTKILDKQGEITVKQFFDSRPSKALDEIFYVMRLANHKDYEITQTLSDTIIKKKGFIEAVTPAEIDQNLADVFGITLNEHRTDKK